MRNFSTDDGIAHFLNSSLNRSAIDQVKTDVLSGKTKLLYVAPESLTKEETLNFSRQFPSRSMPSTKPTAFRSGATISGRNTAASAP